MVSEIETYDEFCDLVKDELVVIDVYASWCGPCKIISPLFEELSERYLKLKCYKINCDNPQIEQFLTEYKVNSLPSFYFLINGTVVDSFSGCNKKKLEELFKNLNGVTL